MRILLKLSPQQDTPQPVPQYSIQSSLYRILKTINKDNIHDSGRYKYFCFSNIFPYKINQSFLQDEILNLMISTPDIDLINNLKSFFDFKPDLFFMIDRKKYIFNVVESKKLQIDPVGKILSTSTPISITMPGYLFEKYGIKSERQSVHWTNKMPLNAFIDALTNNLIYKYEKYHSLTFDKDIPLFRSFKFKGFALVPYKNTKIACSRWELNPISETDIQRDIIKFGVEVGFGQRNSAGFGFINPISR